jgi:hypothetical protein
MEILTPSCIPAGRMVVEHLVGAGGREGGQADPVFLPSQPRRLIVAERRGGAMFKIDKCACAHVSLEELMTVLPAFCET